MPSISIVCDGQGGSEEEVVLVEFQGKLESALEGGSMGNVYLGRLSVTPEGPAFTIGNQRLCGRTVKLAKPLALLRHTARPAEGGGGTVAVVCVIRQKYLFDSRPSTIF